MTKYQQFISFLFVSLAKGEEEIYVLFITIIFVFVAVVGFCFFFFVFFFGNVALEGSYSIN